MKQHITCALALILALPLSACTADKTDSDFFDDGLYTVQFKNVTVTTSPGGELPVVETKDLDFTVNAITSYLTTDDAYSYCYATGGTVLKSPYPYLCGYQGSAFLMVFDEDQLYPGQIAGTLAGPSTALEIYAQYSPTISTDEFSQDTLRALAEDSPTPSATPSATEEPTDVTPEITPTPTEGTPGEATPVVIGEVSCARTANHWTYGQILSRTELHIILRIADVTTCKDEEGNTVISAGSRVDLEAEGILTIAE